MKWIKEHLLTLITAAIGLGSSYYFYRVSLKEPGFSFIDRAPHLQIIDFSKLTTSSLRLVRADGKPFAKNVFVSEFYVWNSGDLPIRKLNVLKPLKITFDDSVEILDCTVIAAPRSDITEFKISLNEPRSIALDFKILEPEDGISVQIVYSADYAAEAKLEGAIEGVRHLGSATTSVNLAAFRNVVFIAVILLFSIMTLVGILHLTEKYLSNPIKKITSAIPLGIQSFLTTLALVLILIGMTSAWVYFLFTSSRDRIRSHGDAVVPSSLLEIK